MRKIIFCISLIGLFACDKNEFNQAVGGDNVVTNPSTTGSKIFATVRLADNREGIAVLKPDGSRDVNYPLVSPSKLTNASCPFTGAGVPNSGLGVTGEGIVFYASGTDLLVSAEKRYSAVGGLVNQLKPLFNPLHEVEGLTYFLPFITSGDQSVVFSDVEAITIGQNPQNGPYREVVSSPTPVRLGNAMEYVASTTVIFTVDNFNRLYGFSMQTGSILTGCPNLLPNGFQYDLDAFVPNGRYKLAVTSSSLFVYEVNSGKVFRFDYLDDGTLKHDVNYQSIGHGNIGIPVADSPSCTGPVQNSSFCIMGVENNRGGISGKTSFVSYQQANPCGGYQVMYELSNNDYDSDHKVFQNRITVDNTVLYIYDMSAANFAGYDVGKL